MKNLIFSSYNNGLSDLAFGRKLAELLEEMYPNAEITVVTNPTDTINAVKNLELQQSLPGFNNNAKYQVTPLNLYEQILQARKETVSPELPPV